MNEAAPKSEKQVSHAVNLLDRLYHSRFMEILDAVHFEDFCNSVSTQLETSNPKIDQKFIVQFFISETPAELADPDAMHWFAVVYRVIQTDDGILMDSESAVYPREATHDLIDIPELNDIPFYTLQWDDIAWNQFDPNQPVHPEL